MPELLKISRRKDKSNYFRIYKKFIQLIKYNIVKEKDLMKLSLITILYIFYPRFYYIDISDLQGRILLWR